MAITAVFLFPGSINIAGRGRNLLGIGVDYFAGGAGAPDYGSLQNISVALFVLAIVVLFQRFGKGLVKNSAILSFAALFVTSGLETIGNTSGITIAGFDREANERETSGAILADILFLITDPRDIEKAKEAMLG